MKYDVFKMKHSDKVPNRRKETHHKPKKQEMFQPKTKTMHIAFCNILYIDEEQSKFNNFN